MPRGFLVIAYIVLLQLFVFSSQHFLFTLNLTLYKSELKMTEKKVFFIFLKSFCICNCLTVNSYSLFHPMFFFSIFSFHFFSPLFILFSFFPFFLFFAFSLISFDSSLFYFHFFLFPLFFFHFLFYLYFPTSLFFFSFFLFSSSFFLSFFFLFFFVFVFFLLVSLSFLCCFIF